MKLTCTNSKTSSSIHNTAFIKRLFERDINRFKIEKFSNIDKNPNDFKSIYLYTTKDLQLVNE